MRLLLTIAISLLSANPVFPQDIVESIRQKVRVIDSNNSLEKLDFKDYESYEQSFDGGNVIEIYQINQKIAKARETVGLSRGRLTTTVYYDNEEPLLVKEVEETFPWNDSEYRFDYTQLDSTFEEMVYLQNGQIVKIEQTGQRSISERTDKATEYNSIIKRMKQLASQKRND